MSLPSSTPPPSSLCCLFAAHWRVLFSTLWSRKEHITFLEARALVQSVSVIGWQAHAKRVQILSDSLAVILASTKERSFRRGTCRALRTTGALVLTWVPLLATRWVPSEINVAGTRSRCGLRPFTKDRPHFASGPARVLRGIRLSRLPPVIVEDPELNGGVSRKRSPVLAPRPLQFAKTAKDRALLRHLSMFPIPGRTDLERMYAGLMTPCKLASCTLGISDSTLETAPSLTWERGIQTIFDLEKDELELDDAVAGFINAAFWEGSHSSLEARLASALVWAESNFPCVRQASVAARRCSGNSSARAHPCVSGGDWRERQRGKGTTWI